MSDANRSCRIGVILAAGRGRRMGATKQLKLWPTANGPKLLICAAYDAIRPICDEMVIVLGHEAEAVASALGARHFRRVDSNADQPMFESIRVGLRGALAVDAAATVVLQPGDHPEVAKSTLRALVSWSLKQPGQAIIPQCNDRGGHPVLIPAIIGRAIVETECPDGLGQYWLDHPELCCRVLVDDVSMLRDVDTPADLLP
jgi:CTP:molybdopterin cytidylyltransferase MocA